MKKKLIIIKIGGAIIDEPQLLEKFLHQFAAISANKILVHGGGKLATDMARQLGVEQQMLNGRRITDAATLKIVTMVYAGYINKNLVAALNAKGTTSIGLTGADGQLIGAHQRKHPTIDYGWVGDIDTVNVNFLQTLLSNGLLPVIAPITCDTSGQLLNTNADTIAASLATSLAENYQVELVYAFEHGGVLRDIHDSNSVIHAINSRLYQQLLADQVISGGMLPKLHNAFHTLIKGVEKVIIGDATQLNELLAGKAGTTMTND
jgi:acetylglutamate kinase